MPAAPCLLRKEATEGQMAGAALSRTCDVRRVPALLIHVTETTLPGRLPFTTAVSSFDEPIRRPAASVITSPETMPAEAAPVPHSTPMPSAPARAGAIAAGASTSALVDTHPPPESAAPVPLPCPCARCREGDDDLPDPTTTPRKPSTPRLMPGPGRPSMICRSAAMAALIGIT